jgi:hypothetical protein
MSYSQQNATGAQATALVDVNYELTDDDDIPASDGSREEIAEPARVKVVVPGVVLADYVFSTAASALALVYAAIFLRTLFGMADTWGGDAAGVTRSVSDNPQTVIAVCLIFAASFIWLWRGAVGKALAILPYAFILWQYYQWISTTTQINPGPGGKVIPPVWPLTNMMFGSSWLDVLMLPAVIALLCFNIYFMKKNIKAAKAGRVGKQSRSEDRFNARRAHNH